MRTDHPDTEYELKITKLPVWLVGGLLAVRYEWELKEVYNPGTDDERHIPPTVPSPLETKGKTFTKLGALRDASKTIRKSNSFYDQTPDKYRWTK